MRRAATHKRKRGTSAKRPIDKRIVNIDQAFTTAQTNVSLYPPSPGLGGGATFPGTVTGLRWCINVTSTDTVLMNTLFWCIIKLREGVAAPSLIGVSSGDSIYNPEQDVMVCGKISVGALSGTQVVTAHYRDEGQTKTMRKLMAGDKLVFTARCLQATTVGAVIYCSAFVEFFFKS